MTPAAISFTMPLNIVRLSLIAFMPQFTLLPPLSLYIHIPWCVRKCPYCDFNSHAAGEHLPEDEYIQALVRDLEQQLPSVWGRRLQSIFIGGGTPSLFSPTALQTLLSHIRMLIPCPPNMEVTMEANPGTFEQEKFNGFFQAGINRLSIGVQSFNDKQLKQLGRIHSAQEALNAIEMAKQAGFENINLDIMFGLPEQSLKQGLQDLQTAIDCQPSHLSWYQLTVEPNTLFYSQPPSLPDDEDIWELQQQGQALLQQHGYQQYEISAYAKSGKQCQHNLNYWQFGDYLAIGAGAHGKISRADDHSIRRYAQHRQPQQYLDATNKTSSEHFISNADRSYEFMLNSLRLKQGFTLELFEQYTGLNRQVIEGRCEQAIEKGLLSRQGSQLRASETGYLFLNDLINLFYPDDAN